MQIIVQVQVKLPCWAGVIHSSLLNSTEVTGEGRAVV
jgi:hypothetical protein